MGIRELCVNGFDIDEGCKLARVVWIYVLLSILLKRLPVLKTDVEEIPDEEKVLFSGNGILVGLGISETTDRVGTARLAEGTEPEKLLFENKLEDTEMVSLPGKRELVGARVWELGRVKTSGIQSVLTTLASELIVEGRDRVEAFWATAVGNGKKFPEVSEESEAVS